MTGIPLPVRTVITQMDLVVHPVIHRAKRVRDPKAHNARLVIPDINWLTDNVSKMNPNRRTRSTLVRRA